MMTYLLYLAHLVSQRHWFPLLEAAFWPFQIHSEQFWDDLWLSTSVADQYCSICLPFGHCSHCQAHSSKSHRCLVQHHNLWYHIVAFSIIINPGFHPSSLNLTLHILLLTPDTSKITGRPSQDHQSFHYLVQLIQIVMRQTFIDHFDLFLNCNGFANEDFATAAPVGLGLLSWADWSWCLSLQSFVSRCPRPAAGFIDWALMEKASRNSTEPELIAVPESGSAEVAIEVVDYRAWRWKRSRSFQSGQLWSFQARAQFILSQGQECQISTDCLQDRIAHYHRCTWPEHGSDSLRYQRLWHHSHDLCPIWTPSSQYLA